MPTRHFKRSNPLVHLLRGGPLLTPLRPFGGEDAARERRARVERVECARVVAHRCFLLGERDPDLARVLAVPPCCVESPPCLSGKLVASPAAKTSGTSGTRPCRSTGMNPCALYGRPAIAGPTSRGSAITWSAATDGASVSSSHPSRTRLGR